MSRHRQLPIILFLWCVLILTTTACGPTFSTPEGAKNVHQLLKKSVDEWLSSPNWARADGFVYTVDVGHLLIYAAMRKDSKLYQSMRKFAVDNLILDNPDDEYTRGFVAWRYKKGVKLDASGTTEALRIAEGLWRGYKAFGNAVDKELTLKILQGYLRHEYTERGIWLVRNYFNLGTRSFVTNSFLVDYDPDFLREVGKELNDKDLLNLANRSYLLVRKAVTKAGLLYSVIQPEVGTLLPLDLAFFSPNDVIKLLNVSTVAERVAHGEPKVAKDVLKFVMLRWEELNNYYYGRTGEPAIRDAVDVSTYASLVRLAIRLDDVTSLKKLLPRFLDGALKFTNNPSAPKLYVAGEVLLALEMLEQYPCGQSKVCWNNP
jgi:hypothetical protein